MNVPRWRRSSSRTVRAVATIACLCASLVIAQTPAHALDTNDVTTPVTGNATWFSGLGGPYGGCGMTQDALETQDFVALNVYNTPGNYDFYNRPLTGADLTRMGMWDNGHNCGRWVQVTIGDYCTGTNDGAMNQPFCRNGSWVADKYNGATLNLIVADSCGDSNAWCRDDPYHLDFNHDSLNRFQLNGVAVKDMDPEHWNNRHMSWKFIPAPNYTGDIQIGFLQGAQTWWGAASVSHLANGMHGIDYYNNGTWSAAVMDGDMGQAYILKPTEDGGTDFAIRVHDMTDALINNGRIYQFSLPASCSPQCGTAYTKISYTTSDTGQISTPTPTTSTSGTGTGTAACTASIKTANAWPGGFQADVTVTAGSSTLHSWNVSWTLDSGQSIAQGGGATWGGIFTISGSSVSVKNAPYNGALAPGKTASLGFVSAGAPSTPTLTCTGS